MLDYPIVIRMTILYNRAVCCKEMRSLKIKEPLDGSMNVRTEQAYYEPRVGGIFCLFLLLTPGTDITMSIWDCADFQDEDRYLLLQQFTRSGIDSLLDREDVKLEEVLRSEDLIQEVNGFNENLIGYLQKPEIAKELFK